MPARQQKRQSTVEKLITQGEGDFAAVVDDLSHFLKEGPRLAALRYAILTFCELSEWALAQDEYDALFPQDSKLRFKFPEHMISRFATGATEKTRNPRGPVHLLLMLIHVCHHRPAQGVLRDVLDVNDTFQLACDYLEHRDRTILASTSEAIDIQTIVTAFRNQLQLNDDDKTVAKAIFNTDDPPENIHDVAYYAMYRYTVEPDLIVKTFAAIQGPRLARFGCFSFTHVYAATNGKSPRKTRGPVLGYDKSIYLIGASAGERSGKPRNQALKIIAVPESEFVADNAVVAGLYMSNTPKWNPVVGRIAIQFLGFQSVIGQRDHKTADVRTIGSEEDLIKDIKDQGVQFDNKLSDEATKEIAHRILSIIGNQTVGDAATANQRRAITVYPSRKG